MYFKYSSHKLTILRILINILYLASISNKTFRENFSCKFRLALTRMSWPNIAIITVIADDNAPLVIEKNF